jgi:hypothetical protein
MTEHFKGPILFPHCTTMSEKYIQSSTSEKEL